MQNDKADKEVISVSDQSDCDDVINETQDFRLNREGLINETSAFRYTDTILIPLQSIYSQELSLQ